MLSTWFMSFSASLPKLPYLLQLKIIIITIICIIVIIIIIIIIIIIMLTLSKTMLENTVEIEPQFQEPFSIF